MTDQPEYLQIAWGELDTAEFPGAANNPVVLDYHVTTEGGSSPDQVSWCSSFVNWCVVSSGLSGTNSKAARSWLLWGESTSENEIGSVCVLWRVARDSWQGHVGFLVGYDAENVYLLGGNQSNRVRVSRYAKTRVLSYRRPVPVLAPTREA